MSIDVSKVLESIKAYYDSLSDLELKNRMQKAGFNIVNDVPGEILYTEKTDNAGDFILQGKVTEVQSFKPVEFDLSEINEKVA